MSQERFDIIINTQTGDPKGIKNTEKGLTNLKNAADTSKMSIGQMRKELLQLRNMDFGNLSAKEIKEVEARMGDLTDATEKANQRVKAIATDTFPAVVQGLSLITSSVQIATGAMSMFGVSSEVAEKLEQRMVQLIGVTQALSRIQQLYASGALKVIALKTKQAAVSLKLMLAQIKLNIAANAFPIFLIITGIAAVITIFVTFRKKITEMVQKFKEMNDWVKILAAVILFPISPIILLIGYFDEIVAYGKKLANTLVFWKDLQFETEKANEEQKKSIDLTERLRKAREKYASDLEHEIALMKARGEETDKIIEKERELLTFRIREAQARVKAEEMVAKAMGPLAKARQKQLEESRNALIALEQELEIFDAKEDKRQADLEAKEQKRREDELKKINENNKKKEEEQKEFLKKEAMALAELDILNAINDEEELARHKELLKLRFEQETEALDEESNQYKLKKKELNNEIEELEKEYNDKALAREEKLRNDLITLNEKFDDMLRQEIVTANENNEKSIMERYRSELGALRDAFREKKEIIKQNYEEEKQILFEQREAGLLSDEEYESKILDLKNKYKEINAVAQANQNNAEIKLNKEKEDKITEQLRKAFDERQSINQAYVNGVKNLISSMVEFELSSSEKSEEEQKRIKKKYALINGAVSMAQLGIDTANAVMNIQAKWAANPILSQILTAMTLATSVAQAGVIATNTAKIRALKYGGNISGKLHSQGGEIVELERDEAVINRQSMMNPIASTLADISNQMGGGVPLTNNRVEIIDYDKLASLINDKQVTLSEYDVTHTQKKVKMIETLTSF